MTFLRIKYFFLFLLSVLAINSAGQIMECENPVPIDFRVLSAQKLETSACQHRGKKGRDHKAEESFLLASRNLTNDVLTSGRVLFNDPVSDHLNRILDELLKNDPELKNSVRAYALRSTAVNAFVTDNGIILVSLGLIARAKNEAQLAFILSHELCHYTEKHVMDAYLKDLELEPLRSKYAVNNRDERFFASAHYSREMEMVADSVAFKRMIATEYGTAGILDVYDMLKYAHLPIYNTIFDQGFFNMEEFSIGDDLFLKEVRKPKPRDEENSQSPTHPALKQRESVMREMMHDHKSPHARQFVISETQFVKARQLCRTECVGLYQIADDPVMAIYIAYTILHHEPNNPFVNKQLGKALYTVAKAVNGGFKNDILSGFSEIEGEAQQLYHLLYMMDERGVSVLALRFLWKLKQQDPSDPDIEAMAADLLSELISKHHMSSPFSVPDELRREDLMLNGPTNDSLSIGPGWTERSLIPLFSDTIFLRLYTEFATENKSMESEPVRIEKRSKSSKRKPASTAQRSAVGAQKVVFVDPKYGRYDNRQPRKTQFRPIGAARLLYEQRIRKTADMVGLKYEMLSISSIDTIDADRFNDMVFLNQWVDGRLKNMESKMVITDRDRLNSLIEKYGTEYFVWTGLLNYREPTSVRLYHALYALAPPALPLSFYYLLRPNYRSYFYSICFNLRTGQQEMVLYNSIGLSDAQDVVNSNIYDSVFQLKRTPVQ